MTLYYVDRMRMRLIGKFNVQFNVSSFYNENCFNITILILDTRLYFLSIIRMKQVLIINQCIKIIYNYLKVRYKYEEVL